MPGDSHSDQPHGLDRGRADECGNVVPVLIDAEVGVAPPRLQEQDEAERCAHDLH
jgi:hypothetical protein